MDTMYPGKINSPATTLSGGIDDIATTVLLIDTSVLPAAANLAVIGTGEDAETIIYTVISGNYLTGCTRGFQGTAKSWDNGTSVARFFTAYDYDTLRTNLADHDPATTGVHGLGDFTFGDATSESVSLYVDAGLGSDSNPGTSASPKATVLGALAVLPSTIAHSCYIKVRPGTYAEGNATIGFARFNCLTSITIQAVNDNDELMYDNGLATGATSTTLTDSTKSWATNQFDGAYIWIYDGTGQGIAVEEIASNTATVITLVGTFDTTPSTNSYYAIGGGVTMSSTSTHVSVHGFKNANVHGFRHINATLNCICWQTYSKGSCYNNYIPSVPSARAGLYSQGLSDAMFYYNYVGISGSGTQYGCRLIQASAWPRANVFVGDDSTGYGVSVERMSIAQMTSSGALQNTFKDCSVGVRVVEGSGCQQIAAQNYISCLTDYSVDSSSWNT